jgi:hypothetical protein
VIFCHRRQEPLTLILLLTCFICIVRILLAGTMLALLACILAKLGVNRTKAQMAIYKALGGRTHWFTKGNLHWIFYKLFCLVFGEVLPSALQIDLVFIFLRVAFVVYSRSTVSTKWWFTKTHPRSAAPISTPDSSATPLSSCGHNLSST